MSCRERLFTAPSTSRTGGRASDEAVTEAYAVLDPMLARYDEATEGLYFPGVDADPLAVGREIARILALPVGAKPFRGVVDFTRS